jgi:type I restriction enzyme S subunit
MQNQIPSKWQKVKLGEIMNVYGGGTPSTKKASNWNGNIPWLTPAELTNHNNRSIGRTASCITESGLKNSSARIMPKNSILLTSRATIGNVTLNTVPMATNQGFINIDPVKVDRDFLYYWLKKNRTYLNQIAVGSTFPEISKSVFKEIETIIPIDRVEQKNIGMFLSAFDDKIEANNKIAKTLEEMAQAIFKEWFLNRKVGWEDKRLDTLLTLKHGLAFKSGQFVIDKTNFVVVRMGNFQQNGGLQFLENTVYLTETSEYKKYLLKPGDMVMIFSDITREGRLIGNIGLIPNDGKDYYLNQRVVKIETDLIYKYFLLSLFNSSKFHQHCLSRADSATVLNLKNEHIYEFKVQIPDEKTIRRFNDLIKPIFDTTELLKLENQELTTVRDLLLLKLMRGEIRI